jgi:hypothetical protein
MQDKEGNFSAFDIAGLFFWGILDFLVPAEAGEFGW